ncbi:MAG: helicase-associated domain-containing protein [Firmicutes bacterium]|nr:helicase-associated domain-containing protein [Bacillota bacterium]
MSLKAYLERMGTYGGKDTLPYFLKLAGIKTSQRKKAEMVSILDKYLSDEQNIIRIWNILNPFEKELVEEYVRAGGRLDSSEIKHILEKHGRERKSYHYGYLVEQFDDYSPARLFFVPYSIPAPIFNILKKLVKPLEIRYTALERLPDRDIIDKELVIRESFEKDFINTIMLINNAKLKATKGSNLPVKSAVLKINEALENKEVLTSGFSSMDDIRTVEQTNRIYGICRLLSEAGIVEESDGMLIIGSRAKEFLKLNLAEKCDMLLKAYIRSEVIYELDRIREIKIKTSMRPNFKTCRELILKYLLGCPVNKWIKMNEFLKYIKKMDRNFLTNVVGSIDSYDDYYRYYTGRTQDWEEIEGRFIEIMFFEYLSVMGIVDVALVEDSDEYGNTEFFSVKYFRVTPLGAYVLGMTDNYNLNEKAEKSGFIVQPNYEIIVSEGSMKHNHILFFDKFAEKISEDTVSIYKLSFKAAVNALDNGISIREIIDYLKENSENNIPENVLLTLEEWERESKRIKIRTVTIIECDDRYLMEELKSYKTINNNILNELPYVFEIDSKSANKVKREIEKKNHFCIIRITK